MATKPNWPSLVKGNKSINVFALQCLLVYHGASIDIDGSYGNGTKTAVTDYQSNHNLKADGGAGKDTLSSMVVTVSLGTKNDAAKAAQYLLNKFEAMDVDGSFGNGSKTATQKFQKAMGITETGSVDATTWQYLFGYNMYPNSGSKDAYASVCMYGSTLSDTQMTTNAKYVCNYLMGQGFTKNAACGVLGNMQQESGINPGIWQVFNDTKQGYGLVQWTPATNFIDRAKETGAISAATATATNALALTDSVALIKAELACLIWRCTKQSPDFFKPDAGGSMDHTGIRVTFAEYKASTLDAGTLAKVFHDHYERSKASASALEERATKATNWYNSL